MKMNEFLFLRNNNFGFSDQNSNILIIAFRLSWNRFIKDFRSNKNPTFNESMFVHSQQRQQNQHIRDKRSHSNSCSFLRSLLLPQLHTRSLSKSSPSSLIITSLLMLNKYCPVVAGILSSTCIFTCMMIVSRRAERKS